MGRKSVEQQHPTFTVEDREPEGVVIPLSACPPELRLLSQGKTVGLKVMGRLTPEGVQVEAVILQR